jgi:hypothetical protein
MAGEREGQGWVKQSPLNPFFSATLAPGDASKRSHFVQCSNKFAHYQYRPTSFRISTSFPTTNMVLASGCQASGYQASGYQASGCQASGYQISGCQASGYQASGCQAFGYQASGYKASGYQASGYKASGYQTSGYTKLLATKLLAIKLLAPKLLAMLLATKLLAFKLSALCIPFLKKPKQITTILFPEGMLCSHAGRQALKPCYRPACYGARFRAPGPEALFSASMLYSHAQVARP